MYMWKSRQMLTGDERWVCFSCLFVHSLLKPLLPCHMSSPLPRDRHWERCGCRIDVTKGRRVFCHQSKWHRWGSVLCEENSKKVTFSSRLWRFGARLVNCFFLRLSLSACLWTHSPIWPGHTGQGIDWPCTINGDTGGCLIGPYLRRLDFLRRCDRSRHRGLGRGKICDPKSGEANSTSGLRVGMVKNSRIHVTVLFNFLWVAALG